MDTVAQFADPEAAGIQKELEAVLGTKVKVEKSGETGKLIISFYSPEELRGLVTKLTSFTPDASSPPLPPLSF